MRPVLELNQPSLALGGYPTVPTKAHLVELRGIEPLSAIVFPLGE